MKDKYTISEISLINNKFNIELKNLNLSHFCDVEVGLKNIKTKEIIPVSSFLGENRILINLDSARELCTNYEYNIVLNFHNSNLNEALETTLSSVFINSGKLKELNLNSIGWFLRINDKNIPLLSAIKK